MKNIKTAVIGVGNMGRHHARVYSEISDLVAVSEINEKIGRGIADEYGVPLYKDYKKMLRDEMIDAVSIAVPTSLHTTIAIDCLNKKLATFVEKPLAKTEKEAKDIIAASKRNNVLLAVGHIERYNPAITKLKKMVDVGELGEILCMLAVRVGIAPPSQQGSDVVSDLAIHDIDIFNYLLGETPIKTKIVKSQLIKNNLSDTAAIVLEYKNATGMIQTNWVTPIKVRKLYVTGSKQYIELDYIKQKIISYKRSLGKRYNGSFNQFEASYKPVEKKIFFSKKEPLREELLNFIMCIKSNKLMDTSYALDAVKIVAV